MSMLTLLLVGLLMQGNASVLSDAQVAAAVAAGLKQPKQTTVNINAGTEYVIQLQGPTLRITGHAADAARKFLPFTVADVTPEMLSPLVDVIVWPQSPQFFPYSGWRVPQPVTHIVIKKGEQVIQPQGFEQFPMEWSNANGGKFQGAGGKARFDLSSLPAGDLEIAVVAGATGVKTIKAKDRERLR